MFGEHALYTGGKYFGLICNSKLFFKTSSRLVELIGDDELRAYEGSKSSLRIPEEILEDQDKLKQIVSQYL